MEEEVVATKRTVSLTINLGILNSFVAKIGSTFQKKHLCQPGIGLLRQENLPAKRCSRLQRCVKPELQISVMQGLRSLETGMLNKLAFL